MSIFIHKIYKADLAYNTSIDITLTGMANSTGMAISHFADCDKSAMASIPYSIEVVREAVPVISEVEFGVAVRKPVDLTAIGVNTKTIQDVGNDVGKYEDKNSVPHRPSSPPPGFQELYKG